MSDGRRVLAGVIAAHAGQPGACIVWDLDGTLFDPRPRMLRSVQAFGYREAGLADVDVSWQKTAVRLGLDPIAFQAAWHDTFWTADAILSDTPITDTVWALRWTAALGLSPIFVTGRVEALRGVTLTQLRRLGLLTPTLVMKDDTDLETAAFKASAIAALQHGGATVAAFVTDSRREIRTARAALPALPCVLVVGVGGDDGDGNDDGGDSDIPRWHIDTGANTVDDMPVLPLGLPMTPWMVQAVAHDLGRVLAQTPVWQPITTRAQAHALWVTGGTSVADTDAAVARITRLGCEHQLNDKEGLARRHTGNLEVAWQGGDAFDLPCLPIDDVTVVRSRHFAISESIELMFRDDDSGHPTGPWLLPVHPQGQTAPPVRWLPQVRGTSSARTVMVGDAGRDPVLLKCHAPHVVLDRHPRTLTARDAAHGVHISDALHTLGTVCFFPEVLAVTDVTADVGCVVRQARPWPARAGTLGTLPAFCLWSQAAAFDSGPAVMVRLRAQLGDDVTVERVLRPLTELALHLAVDLGCAFMGHGQNIHVEFDDDGTPTGRVVLADLEDVWPHPVITHALDLPFVLDDAYMAEHVDSAESSIENAFQDHFIWRLLHPLLQTVEDLRPAANRLLRDGVVARAAQVRRFSPGPLSWFAETFLD